MRSIRLLPLVLLVACGDNHGQNHPPDAPPHADAAVDAHVPLTCGYTEMNDATNDNFFANGTPETTNLSFGNAFMICGKLDSTHYEQNSMLVDVDSYKVTVPAQSSGLLYIQAPGAEALNTVLIEIYGMTTNTDEVGKFEPTSGFAMASARLAPGDYVINVSAFHSAAPAASIDYKLVLAPDSPTRCAKSTAAADYTENLDGVTADGNDIYEVRYMGSPKRAFTANALDVVEPTGIMVAPGGSYHIVGTNSKPTVTPADWADFYQDRDTYQITMGANANQLSLRLNWPGSTADMDFLVFPMGGLNDFANGYYNATMEDEFATFAVIPGMSYWVFVAADDTSTGQPINYDLTACGATFTPVP